MFSATSILGALVSRGVRGVAGSALGSSDTPFPASMPSGVGLAAGAAGVAAAGGLAYLAYRHFSAPTPPGAVPPPMGPGAPPIGPGAPMGGSAPSGGAGGLLGGLVSAPTSGGQGPPPAGGGGFDPYAFQRGGGAQSGGAPAVAPGSSTAGAAPSAPLPRDFPAFPPGSSPTSVSTANVGAPDPAREADALLLVRAMIAAAHVDGVIDASERAAILARVGDAGLGPAERRALEHELEAPRPPRELLAQIRDGEMARQFYLVSLLAITPDNDAERGYVAGLPALLGLSAGDVAEVHSALGAPPGAAPPLG